MPINFYEKKLTEKYEGQKFLTAAFEGNLFLNKVRTCLAVT